MMHDPIADWLFHPLPADSFLADFWAKEHHVVRRDDPGYFDDLFSAKALEEFLEYGRPDPAGVRMVKGKEKKDLQSYRLGNGAIALVALRTDFAAGFPIILTRLARLFSSVAA